MTRRDFVLAAGLAAAAGALTAGCGSPAAPAAATAADLALYYQALVGGGGGVWQPETIAEVRRIRNPDFVEPLFGRPANRGLGVVVAGGPEKVFLGFDASGAPAGYAVTGAEPGFQDVIQLIFGYDVDSGRLLGMKVLESKETPGLGDKIIKDMNFVNGFQGVSAPIVGVKQGAGTGSENEVDMITGATISSRAVIGIINHRLEALGPALTEHEPGPAPQAPPVATADSSAGAGGDEGS